MSFDKTVTLSVRECPRCRGDHERVRFVPDLSGGPTPAHTHRGICPVTREVFWMNTKKNPGVWERLLQAAGITD